MEMKPNNYPEIHLFAQESGFKDGYRQCLQDLSLGFPEIKEDPTQPEKVYSAFSAPKKK
jgi:hypothetical protein